MTDKFLNIIWLERSRNRWRLLAMLVTAILVFWGWGAWRAVPSELKPEKSHIARVAVMGMILEDDYATATLPPAAPWWAV